MSLLNKETSSERADAKQTPEKSRVHTYQSAQELNMGLNTILNPSKRLQILLKPRPIGGINVPCEDKRCLSHVGAFDIGAAA